jgi:iron complex outermembrane recepter protein
MKFQSIFGTAASTLAIGAAFIAMPAFAQSTGSVDFDEGEIVVTGTRASDVGGVQIPDSPKAKVVLTNEVLMRQRAGQSVNEIINLVPGVSFTNNDPFGSSGGSFTIRGFDSSRISQTFDGIPLNDSGNYAIYTNQQVDAELIETVNVNLGSTDGDSPTAAAVGGTVNINTLTPSDEFGVMTSMTYGDIIAEGSDAFDRHDRDFIRFFGKVETGELTSLGTKAWFAASYARNGATFANYGKIEKQQYNGKIYQPIGTNGDFISIAGHYNQNRNNFGGSPLRANAFTGDKDGRFYEVSGGYPCTVDVAQPGVADSPNACGTAFERRYNPSNTGNVRLASKFTLTDRLTFSVDGAFQYVKANGGGTTSANEGLYTRNGFSGSGNYGGQFYFGGVDLNDDGDALDRVTVLQPSQTQTRRWVAIANLAYELDDSNRIRAFYSFDRARHRQTGQAGYVLANGEPVDVFPVNDPLTNAAGDELNKRDRLSYAILHKVGAEYRGSFADDALNITLGVSAPFFERDLTQNCFTTSSGGFVDCVPESQRAAYQAAFPYAYNEATGQSSGSALPQQRTLKYDKILPNAGIVYNFTPAMSVAFSYSRNISAPSTDALYNAFYFPDGSDNAYKVAEVSDSFDASLRYTNSRVQAALTGWFAKYKNRLVTAYDIDGNATDTNLGPVDKYGVDASISVAPTPNTLLYVFGSYIMSDIKEDAITSASNCNAARQAAGVCYVDNGVYYYNTSGNRERGAPKWLLGARAQGSLGDFDLGVQAKYTGDRYLNDLNFDDNVYGAKFKSYTVVDLDVRYSLENALGWEKSYLQFNVTNLFDKFYVGSFSGGLDTSPSSSSAFVNFGSPRAFSTTLVLGF